LTEKEWVSCNSPYQMLQFLDGRIDDLTFTRFSIMCCKRIWCLITDLRSRAFVAVTEQLLDGVTTKEMAQPIYDAWWDAYEGDQLVDAEGGSTNEAVEMVAYKGSNAATACSTRCFESAGFSASQPLRMAGALQEVITHAWKTAEKEEKTAQCAILRELVGNPFRAK
jgi:hypothetical protein